MLQRFSFPDHSESQIIWFSMMHVFWVLFPPPPSFAMALSRNLGAGQDPGPRLGSWGSLAGLALMFLLLPWQSCPLFVFRDPQLKVGFYWAIQSWGLKKREPWESHIKRLRGRNARLLVKGPFSLMRGRFPYKDIFDLFLHIVAKPECKLECPFFFFSLNLSF